MRARISHRPSQPEGNRFRLDVDIAIPAAGITCVFGPSGSGKTTLLRCLAGLERPQSARIVIGDEVWQDGNHFTPTHSRRIGYVFQDSSLLPHLSAWRNLEFGADRGLRESLARARGNRNHAPPDTAMPGEGGAAADQVSRIIELLGIGHLLDKLPRQLSGGERQRVALARALLGQPKLLLLDEPLSALDLARKRELLPYLESLPKRLDRPIVYVTHSPEEVARLAAQVLVLNNGECVARGSVAELMAAGRLPANAAGERGVVLETRITGRDSRWRLAEAEFAGGALWIADTGVAEGDSVRLRIVARDVSLSLADAAHSSILNRLPATLERIEDCADGALCVAHLRIGAGDRLLARISRKSAARLELTPGDRIYAEIKSVAILR